MSVARARMLEPLYKVDVPLTHAALVVGGGIAGMTAACALGDMGYEVHLVERSAKLGGHALDSAAPSRGGDPAEYVRRARAEARRQPQRQHPPRVGARRLPRLHRQLLGRHRRQATASARPSSTASSSWPPARARSGPSSTASARATASSPAWTSSACSQDDDPALAAAKSVGFMLCAGSLDENKPYCSRTCCAQSIKNAIRAQGSATRPARLRVVQGGPHLRLPRGVLHAGARAGRHLHALRQRRQAAGQRQRRGHGSPTATRTSRRDIELPLDLLVLATPTVPNDGNDELSKLLKVPLTADGFFLEAHVKLRPVDFASEGIFLCGSAHYPKGIDEAISQAYAAAGSRRGRPRQAGAQGRRRGRRGRRGQVRRLPHLRAHLPLRGAASSTPRPRRPRSRRPPARAAASA